MRNELLIISMISHPNVVEMLEYFETNKWIYIAMECCRGGELFHFLDQVDLSEYEIAFIMKQLLEGVEYIHGCGILHRDIKPENILVEFEDDSIENRKRPIYLNANLRVKRVKITDFGLSKIVSSKDQVLDSCGTPAYVAPEVLLKQAYHKEVDVWALGVIMYLMICKVLPFTSQEKRQTFKMIKYEQPNFSRSQFSVVSNMCKDLVKQMLIKDPRQRITTQ